MEQQSACSRNISSHRFTAARGRRMVLSHHTGDQVRLFTLWRPGYAFEQASLRESRILNCFLIESARIDRHVQAVPGALLRCREFCWDDPSKENIGETQRLGGGKAHARND
jgi:hypothetical protein